MEELKPQRDYSPEILLKAVAKAHHDLRRIDDEMGEAFGPNGWFAENTPERIEDRANAFGRQVSALRAALNDLSYTARRLELVKMTGEKF